MDGITLFLFLLAAFLGGFASGFAGFAMGFIVSGIWLHIITPIQVTTLIVGYGLLTQGYGVWKLRRSLNIRNLTPFIVGGAIGIPLGTLLLIGLDPTYLRTIVGVLLIAYSLYGLTRPLPTLLTVGAGVDGAVGFLNGVLSGLTGLPGFLITVWCQFRNWSKDAQRAVFQPVMLAAIVMNAISLSMAGAITRDTIELYGIGLPAMAAGIWVGFKFYGKLDESAFRRLVLVLLLLSGFGLIAAQTWPSVRHLFIAA